MSKFFLLIAVVLSVSFECSINAQSEKPKLSTSGIELLSVFINGAYISFNGLEGYAKFGLDINVADYKHEDKNYPVKQIRDQVELRLRQSKITINDKSGEYHDKLIVNIMPINSSFYLYVFQATRLVFFAKEEVKYSTNSAVVWQKIGSVGKANLRTTIDSVLDRFLLDLLKAQEKHEEFNKSELAAKKKSAAKPNSATPTNK